MGPAVSRDNWDTVYYRLRAILAVCDWIGGDGSREIADPNQRRNRRAVSSRTIFFSPSAAALPIHVTVDAWRGRSSAGVLI